MGPGQRQAEKATWQEKDKFGSTKRSKKRRKQAWETHLETGLGAILQVTVTLCAWVPMETFCSCCSQEGPSWSLMSMNLKNFHKAPKVQGICRKNISTSHCHPCTEGSDHITCGKGL